MSDGKSTPEEWGYDDTHDGCCGRACTPDGCHESHPTGIYVIGGPEWADPEVIGCYGPAVTNEDHARLIAAAPDLLAALVWREQFERRAGEDSVDLFERVAANFHRDTGFLRPGKDCREHAYEDSQAAWEAWMEAGRARVRAAIAKAEGPPA